MGFRLGELMPAALLASILLVAGCANPGVARQPKVIKTPATPQKATKPARLADAAEPASEEFYRWLADAERQNANAQFQVATYYELGRGIARDRSEAIRWFRAAARQGNAEAQYYLGLLYRSANGSDGDPALATHWFEKAAEQGHADAQYQLALAYAQARGVPKSQERSLHWLRLAAEQHHAAAQHALGLCYATGTGVDRDAEKAAAWIYRAGVGFIAQGQREAAKTALLDIEKQIPGHTLVTQLRTRLTLDESAPEYPDLSFVGSSVGTGWPIASGYVVTNNHVVGEAEDITLVNADGETMTASVVARDPIHDLALLSVDDTNWLPLALPLGGWSTDAGSEVFTVGYPRIDLLGETPKLSTGTISAVHGFENDLSTYELNLAIQKGNSGGPLLDENGKVVGVVASMLGAIDTQGNVHPVPGISFAIKIRQLRELLAYLPIHDPAISELPQLRGSVGQLAERIRHSVLIVVAK